MCAKSTSRGFTLPELIAVLMLVGILSVTAMPKLQAALSVRDNGWHDQIVASLHYAHKVAISHRRLVCASVGATDVTLSIASANPASSCNLALPGVDGQAQAASSDGGAAANVSPAGTLYFQPSGRVSTDGAGGSTAIRTITIAGQTNIVLVGETGHVE
jgi:prepilin-type N-terminal cleavage/methylation domain-containing protein